MSERTSVTRRPLLLEFAVVVVLMIPPVGCGGGSQTSTNSASQTKASAAAAASADTLQHCIGFAAGQPWPKPAGPRPETMTFCEQLPEWKSYDQARQAFQANDHTGAARLLLIAARAGNPLAALRLAIMYDHGDAVDLNKQEAFRWYLTAARGGEPAAQAEAGSFYEGGVVVSEDWVEAANWYAQSARVGWSNGQFDLGRAFEYGIGVPLDLQTALDWYARGASQGNARARQAATYLRQNHGIDGSSMSDEEQAIYAELLPGRIMRHTAAPPEAACSTTRPSG